MSCPLAVAVIPRVVSLFATPSQSAQNSNAEQARVASASLYPEQEGFADSNGVMLDYLSAGANRSYSHVVGGGTSHDYSRPCLLALVRRHRLISIDERGSERPERLEDAAG